MFCPTQGRSNLYNNQQFACIDGVIEKNLAQKDIVQNRNGEREIEKWGLLGVGEIFGRLCVEFNSAVD